jgi:hypothetical protein
VVGYVKRESHFQVRAKVGAFALLLPRKIRKQLFLSLAGKRVIPALTLAMWSKRRQRLLLSHSKRQIEIDCGY